MLGSTKSDRRVFSEGLIFWRIMGLQGLLGDARDFKDEFERFIAAGTDKHATMRAREMGSARAAQLRARLAPFFLRRDKKDVLKPARYPAPKKKSKKNSKFTNAICPAQAR